MTDYKIVFVPNNDKCEISDGTDITYYESSIDGLTALVKIEGAGGWIPVGPPTILNFKLPGKGRTGVLAQAMYKP